MREIKFRAWYQNKMHYNITKAHYEHNEMSGHEGDLWDFNEWLKWSKVMQYTGLKDKNGKDIYEGDIVALALKPYHNEKRQCIQRIPNIEEFLDWNDDVTIKEFFEDFEVIGNIFENNERLSPSTITDTNL